MRAQKFNHDTPQLRDSINDSPAYLNRSAYLAKRKTQLTLDIVQMPSPRKYERKLSNRTYQNK